MIFFILVKKVCLKMNPQNLGCRAGRGNGQGPQQIGEHPQENHPVSQGPQEQRRKGAQFFLIP